MEAAAAGAGPEPGLAAGADEAAGALAGLAGRLPDGELLVKKLRSLLKKPMIVIG